ncbi:MAG: VCBS repeat-containing protein [Chryseolinea sp.]
MRTLYWGLFLIVLMGCKGKDSTLFTLIDNEEHGIKFSNTIYENDTINILKLEYVYNGGSVGIGDFNNDGLSDVYLGGNMVQDRLFLNQGDFKFKDVTAESGIAPSNKWRSGIAVADVNGDGWLDIYVCATIRKDSMARANMLYLNKGNNAAGIPTFEEQAEKYGIADKGYSSGAAFFDYDNDGDLDLFVLINIIEKGVPTTFRPKVDDGTALNADRLYRNNGNETFTNVTKQAGILHEGYGLGLAIADINQDGWQDIYVSNDYIANDILYINNKNGTFTNAIDQWIKHQSQFSMGNDIADINNDGLPDIITLDMLPEGNLRRKTVIGGPPYTNYINNKKFHYTHQYVRNMLQLNNGDGTFSEIGQLAGVFQTEWSWSPLFADFDNDGNKDLMITNGFPRDITDKDFGNFRSDPGGAIAGTEFLLDSIPVVKVPNYAFRNNGDLTFTNVSKEWGMNTPSFSNGASFADFDNDGDLDYIVNNINDQVSLYKNNLYSPDARKDTANVSHFIRIRLVGDNANRSGFGTKIVIKAKGKQQYHDHSVSRGYISSVEDVIHFGMGKNMLIDSIEVLWPDGKSQLLTNVKCDQVLKLNHADAKQSNVPMFKQNTAGPLLVEENRAKGISFFHPEEDRIDFNVQRTIPHKFSQAGPGLAIGDINGDGLEDFYIGGSVKSSGSLFIQDKKGAFKSRPLGNAAEKKEEDEGALFFDFDNDHDLDLYIVSGSIEYQPDDPNYQDRLFINDGKGNFKLSTEALPILKQSESCIRSADFDGDGDFDLFTGSRVIPGSYPFANESCILRNDNGKFVNVTNEIAPGLKKAGMITDALWTDFDNDGKLDLILTGEFNAIAAYHNTGGKFTKLTDSGLEKYSGWWNSITGADFDDDGDTDYVAGNLGQNNFYKASDQTPLRIYAKDIDGNGSIDPVMSCYFKSVKGELKEYPLHFWDELNQQSPKFRRKFSHYREYGKTPMDSLFSPEEREGMIILEANYMSSSYIENLGNGKFKVTPLPIAVQFAPVNGIVTSDVDEDGNLDLVMVGNDYGNEVFSGRHDAFYGMVLLGDGKGKFAPKNSKESGFFVPGDAKALACLSSPNGDLIIATQNQDSLKVFGFRKERKQKLFVPEALDSKVEFKFANGKTRKTELYYGSGYLSQSSRCVRIPAEVTEVVVFDTKGGQRKVTVPQ